MRTLGIPGGKLRPGDTFTENNGDLAGLTVMEAAEYGGDVAVALSSGQNMVLPRTFCFEIYRP
jgi:hypothetical protein